jgi:hypothetical protein
VLGRLVERREEAAASQMQPPPLLTPDDADASADERAAVALSCVLALAPHTAPLVLRFFATAPPPLARFSAHTAAALAAQPVAAAPVARALARAALRLADAAAASGDVLLQRAVGVATCCPAALRLARHPDVHVRFAAARLAVSGLALGATSAQALRRQYMTAEEARRRRCCRLASTPARR